MKKLLLILGLLSLLTATALAQSASLSSSASTYSASGGQVTLTATLTYTGLTPTALGFTINLPADWKLVSTGGTNVPGVSPDTSDANNLPTGQLDYAYTSFPLNSASFTATISYPAGLTGDQTITASAIYRSPLTNLTVTSLVITPAPTAPSFTTLPASQTVTSGSSVSFSAAAVGYPAPTLQWRKGGTNISGATSATYTIASVQPADAGSYDVVATNSQGTAFSNVVTLTVNFTPTITTQPTAKTVNASQSASFSVVASGVPAPTYQWRKNSSNISGATNATYTIATTVAADAGNYDVVVTNSIGSVTSNAVALVVNFAPVITTQPAGLTVTSGQSATLTVVASGVPAPTYQWRKGGSNLSGATNALYSIAAAAPADAGSYDVVVTNSLGSVASSAAVLVVNFAPTITTNPGNVTVTQSQGASFSVVASGVPAPTYQWRKNSSNISGATNTTYSIASTVAADAGSYDVVITNSIGSATSSAAVLTVNFAPVISTQPTGLTVNSGSSASFSVAASAVPAPTYQWRKNFSNISGATGAAYTIATTTPSDAANYDVVVSNSLGSVASSAATLVVNFVPIITTNPTNVTVNQGQNATFSIVASSVPAAIFTWQGQEPGTGTFSNLGNGPQFSGVTTSTLTVNANTGALDGWKFQCLVTNILGGTLSNFATLTVNTAPTIITPPTNQSGFEGGSATFTVAAVGKPTPAYQWRRNSASIGGATNASYTRSSLTVAADNNTTFDVVVSNSVGSVTSSPVTLAVSLAPFAPIIGTQPANTTVIQGQTATFTVAATGNPTPAYQWRKAGTNIGGATSASYSIPNAQPADEAAYSVVITNSQGSATSNDATLTVIVPPAIATQPAAVTVNQGQSASFTVAATGTAPLTYQWKKGGANVTGATSATLTIASAQPADEANYTVVVTNSGGNVTSSGATLTVNTAPAITTQPASLTVNQGQAASFTVVFTAKPAPTFQWKKGGTDITGATSATYTIASAQPADEGSFTVVLTNSVGSATSAPAATLTVNTPPVFTTQPVSTSVNQGLDATFTAVVTGKPTPTLQWRKGTTVLADGAKYVGVTTGTLTVKNVQPVDNGDYNVLATNSVVPAGVASSSGTLAVNTAPAITTQPTVAASYLVGANVSITVVATGVPAPTYQWRKGGTAIGGATNATLALTNVQIADRGSFDVVVTNSVASATSNAVTLVIYQLPAFTTHPASQTVVAGQSVTFSAVATGDPAPTLQWRRNGLNISGATNASYTIDAASFDAGGSFTAVATNPGGSVPSNVATLTVNPLAPAITSPLTASGVVGRGFLYQIAAGTTQATYSATGLPAGLTVNSATGVISGTPTTATGTPASVTIGATNVTGSDTKTLSLTILAPPPVITSAAATSGRVGVAFSFTVVATNSPTFSATGLPANLSINSATGAITGTPTTAGQYLASITAANGSGGNTIQLTIVIDPPLNVPSFTGGTNLSGVQGTAFNFTPTFTGGPFTGFSATGLPAGLAINTSTGAITGTPTTVGVSTANLTVTNAGGSATFAFNFTINSAPAAPVITSASTATATAGSPFTFTLTASPASGASFSATGLPGTLSLNSTTGVISGTPSTLATISAQVRASNSTAGPGPVSALVITVRPSATAPVLTSSPAVSGRVGDPLTYTLGGNNVDGATTFAVSNGTLPAGLALNSTTGAVTGTPTQAGTTEVWFAATNGSGPGFALSVHFYILPASTMPVINSNGTAAGQVGQPFLYAIAATNSPTSFGATGLPAGLSLDSATGVISGIPTAPTTTALVIVLTATNASGTGTPKNLSLTIAPAPATPLITSALAAYARVGTAFTYQVTASESPTSYATTNLPAGLALAPSTGVISGTPTQPGSFAVTLRAANAAGLGQPATLTLLVVAAPAAPSIGGTAPDAGKVGASFTYTISATPTPITSFTLTGTLPNGLALNTSTGIISGKPTEPGVFTVQVTATGDGGSSLPQSLVINIAPADNTPVITSPNVAPGTVGANFSYQIAATNPPLLTLDAVNLPPGLAVNPSTGLIQGKPTAVGDTTATLVATNAAGAGPFRDLTIQVGPAPTAPVVTAASVTAQAGVPFSYQIVASGNPDSYEVAGAPTWMTVGNRAGTLAGTPGVPGRLTLQLVATNAGGPSSPATLTIDIQPAAGAPLITSSQTASGQIGAVLTYQIVATNSPTDYYVSGLPAGLALSPTAPGLITGIPTESGTAFRVTLSAKNASGFSMPVILVMKIDGNVKFVVPGT